MYRLVILEDNSAHTQTLIGLLKDFPQADRFEIACVCKPAALKAYLEKRGKPDILLTDIDFGENELNGIQLVGELFPPGSAVQVIYVTGFIEYCTRVYETEHIYFLIKPVKTDELYAALSRALARLDQAEDRLVSVHVGGGVVRILPEAIRYIESDRRKLRIITDQGVTEAYASLTSIAQKLKTGFLHCHKSFLVNMARVAELHGDSFLLLSGETVPISQKRYKASREAFLGFLSDRM